VSFTRNQARGYAGAVTHDDVTPPETIDAMRRFVAAVPGAEAVLARHLADNDEVLPHVLMADLRRFFVTAVETEVETGDDDTVARFAAALETLAASDNENVRNVFQVSFMEDLVVGADQREIAAIAAMRPRMGPATVTDLARWKVVLRVTGIEL